jgi:hypothetical protein
LRRTVIRYTLQVARRALFDKEPVAGLSGLVGLTAPDDEVAGVVDVVVIGAKSDGKTQFITHAIRTLDAQAPAGLSTEEKLQNEKILGLVLNPKRPLPEANPDRKVRHYVFRVKAPAFLGGGIAGGLRLLGGALTWRGIVALLGAAACAAAVRIAHGALDGFALGAAIGAAVLGGAWAFLDAWMAFRRQDEVEVVFWDVAGEDVFGDRGAGDYHQFLAALVRARRQDGGRHALAPALICNPLAVGTLAEDSPFARLRMIMPSFAKLHRAQPDVLVVVNRWDLVRAIVADGEAAADEIVGVVPVGREAAAGATGAAGPPSEALPLVKRSVILRHCVDGDHAPIGGVRFRTIRYEAGLDTQVDEKPWSPELLAGRFSAPATEPSRVVTYRYAEGPGSLGGDAGRGLFAWIAGILWSRAARSSGSAPVDATEVQDSSTTVKMFATPRPTDPSSKEASSGGFRSGT